MELYFLRHAEAEDARSGLADGDRRLTPEGSEATKREAEGLRKLGLKLDLVLTSPLVRARQTAEIVAKALGLPTPTAASQLASGCELADLRSLLSEHADCKRVMLVGHEPDFSRMVSQLVGSASLKLKKGGIARVNADSIESGRGELEWLLTPVHLCL